MSFIPIGLTAIVLTFAARVASSSEVEPRAEGSTAGRIFRCEIAGVPTFSDRPCASIAASHMPGSGTAESQTIELGTLNILESPATNAAPTPVKAARASPRRTAAVKPAAVSRDAKADTCGRLQQSLRKIASTMRSGYSAKEGERLRVRKQALEEKRRMQRC